VKSELGYSGSSYIDMLEGILRANTMKLLEDGIDNINKSRRCTFR